MKLLNKTQIYYSSLFLVILIIWSGVFLYSVSEVLKENIDETLQSELESTLVLLEKESPPSFLVYAEINPLFNFQYISSIQSPQFTFSDTTLYSSFEKEYIPYREISVEKEWLSKPVRISLRKSTIEYDDLFIAILITEFILVLCLVIGVYWMNKGIFRNIWKPFLATLESASSYSLTGNKSLPLSNTDIEEFNKLNEVLVRMTKRIESDYKNLKEFTENASHEIQTPLSVITNRIEVLLQDDKFTTEQWESIKDIYQSATHLSRLNKGLLLLAKIENKQFEETFVDVNSLLKTVLNQFSEEISQLEIELSLKIDNDVQIQGSPELIEIMIRNLISNAIKHNFEKGRIEITLSKTQLSIANTGIVPKTEPDLLFERFKKEENSSSSLGLGLAIVKQICALNGYKESYTFQNSLHKLDIKFN